MILKRKTTILCVKKKQIRKASRAGQVRPRVRIYKSHLFVNNTCDKDTSSMKCGQFVVATSQYGNYTTGATCGA